MSAQQAGAASEHSVPQRNETQPNTPPDTKSNTRVPGTMGGRFFMEMGLKIQIQTSQPETSNSPSHSRTQRLGSLLGSSCWHTKVPTGTEPAGGRRRLGAARRGGERKRTLPERTSQKRTRNKTHAKENVGRSSSLSSRGRTRQLQRQLASPVTSVNGGSCDIEKNAHSQAHQDPHLLLLKYYSRRI